MGTTFPPGSFCEDPLWDLNLTWFTNNPDFTTCFHQTVLTYIPSAFLILFTPIELYLLKQSKNLLIPWTILNISRLVLNLILIILPIIDLAYALNINISDTGYVYPVHITAAAVRIVAFTTVLVLQYLNKKQGMVTSGIIFCYWTLAAVCGAFTFRSVLTTPYVFGENAILPFTTYVFQYPIILALFFLSCWADAKPVYEQLDKQTENLTPEKYASFLSKIIFQWYDPLAIKGWKQLLSENDLWGLTFSNTCRGTVPHWDSSWNREKKSKANSGKPLNILKIIIGAFGPGYFISSVFEFARSVLMFASPQIVNLIIDFVESDEETWKGYLYTILICLATFLTTIVNSQSFYLEYLIGLKVRTAFTSALYRKSLKLSNSARKIMTVGETTNLMAIDTQKFMDMTLYLNLVWSCPLQVVLAMYFLWQILGPSSLAGLAVMIIMLPLNMYAGSLMKKYQFSQMKSKDKRARLMDEILNGIKVLKLYAWEPSFENKVNDIRQEEVKALKKAAFVNAFTTFLWTCAPFVVALASFATYVLSDPNNVLDASTAFVSLTLFNLLSIALNIIPNLIIFMVQCQVSLKRVSKFLNSEELKPGTITHDKSYKNPISIEDGTFSWGKTLDPTLRDINLQIEEGSLVAVVGQVGTGKSSLLSSILGELEIVSGNVNTKGRIAYVPQQAWMQNATLQYNITFGKRYNEDLYNKVLDACALVRDLEMLPGGDQTEIGEKGINLSGGQKQRISMARAVYNNGNVYLLDDPLSAVDAHVGKHMFEQVIGPNGLLKRKTRILVTHGIGYLPYMDKIIVMKDGKISESGTYQSLIDQGGDFAEFLLQYLQEHNDEEDNPLKEESDFEGLKQDLERTMGKEKVQRQLSSLSNQKSVKTSLSDYVSDLDTFNPGKLRRKRKESRNRTISQSTSKVEETKSKKKKTEKKHDLIVEEAMEVGGVKWSIYKYYMKAVEFWPTFNTFFFYLTYQAFSVGANIWLSHWSTDPAANTDTGVRDTYLAVYGVLGVLQSISIMLATAINAIGTLNAAIKLHGTMLKRILTSPMSFFDTTPVGRILNRFAKDIDIVDLTIPLNFRLLLNTSYQVIGTLAVICLANPLFLAVIVPIAIVYYLLQKVYVSTARQVKRLESITRSPIYSHFGETISGSIVIRAFNATERFINENERRIDRNQKCYHPSFVANRWLSVRLESIGNLIVLFASLFAVISKNKVDPGLVGLSLSYALNVTGSLNLLVRMSSEVETNMVSVERIKEYQETPQEAPFDIPENDPPKEWPQYGVVKFDDYGTRYREGLDLVLKGISLEIQSGEKIGIVGRTGAGKSSLTLALFRIIEAAKGAISIDGQNIGILGLGKLRSRLTIIPQDPVLFSGSMRMNLDPFEQYSDRELWKALEHAHLKSYISNLPGGLHFEVTEGGENLSVGQRQLVCLARALLRKTKVLILDEATAAIDFETDDLIQDSIRSEFSDCTVLTIAHRLNTIMDSSRVMVLDAGKIKEFDTPENLLGNKKSVFYGMAKDAGLVGNSKQS